MRLAYRLLVPPLLLARAALRRGTGAETAADLAERLGRAPALPQGPTLWMHGASLGEWTAARDLLAAVLAAHPGLSVLATANTTAGRALVAGWTLPRVTACLAPLDTRPCLAAFLRRQRPVAHLILENELWPNRMAALAARGLPVAIVAARLSARSARRWARFPGLARGLLAPVRLLSAQTPEIADRFRALGLPEAALAPPAMLKSAVTLPAPDPAALAALRPLFPRGATLLAASSHPGEEAIVAQAVAEARRTRPELQLILAPRHPARGAEVSALLTAAGLPHARRSAGEAPAQDHPAYLADTLGEMPLWYALAGLCLVGGSLVPKGGHTPYEPAAAACALLHGPDVANFAEPYAALHAAGAAVEVRDAASLAAALRGLDPAAAEALGQRARAVLAARGADPVPALVARIATALALP